MNYKGIEYEVLNEEQQGDILYLALRKQKNEIEDSEYKFSQRSLNNLKEIHPRLVKVMTEAIKNCPADFTITDGIRTTEQQETLYAKGRIVPGKIVTNADGVKNKSNHQAKSDGYGYAVDLYAYYDGSVQVDDDKTIINKIAPHIKNTAKKLGINISWGGDWTGKLIDYPHFELKK
jgi:peptidoglycan L-alanyl-D-glutamate endopeptidase CwlK